MSSISDEIERRLAPLRGTCDALRTHALRCATRPSQLAPDGRLDLGHTPWIAPLAYAIVLYPPARPEWVRSFARRFALPDEYGQVLLAVNGCHAYALNLYGLAPSMQAKVPGLDRSLFQPLDLSFANQDWRTDYKGAPDAFHFGARHLDEENTGYFWEDRRLVALTYSGRVTGIWKSLSALLAEELPKAEEHMRKQSDGRWVEVQ